MQKFLKNGVGGAGTQNKINDWFPFLLPGSSWIVILMSIITGPSAILFLLITVGLYIINVLIRYIDACLGAIKLVVLISQYEQVPTTESRI